MRDIRKALRERVLALDGAMGTMIQRMGHHGCNDLLVLTHPDDIESIHRRYIDAGADIIETNTFNANAISLQEYGLTDRVYEINRAGAELARRAAGEEQFVAGSMGPTSVSLSMGDCPVSFDEMAAAYEKQARGLIDGGADVLLIETVFDTLNAKAAIVGARRAMNGHDVPLMISATLTENGRLLSGQTLEAFIASVSHANPLSIGLNCGFGVEQMLPFIERLQQVPFAVSLHANAGLPDELGRYRQTPEGMSFSLGRLLDRDMLNIVGGCCGTTPDHIRLIAAAAAKARPRIPAPKPHTLILAGLDRVSADRFLKVGERCNVAGSRNFLRLIEQGETNKAVDTAAAQIEAGADVLDINMDDGMLNARSEMRRFVARLGADSRTASAPLMIDSSDFAVITDALKLIQGKPIVNSISLKEGEKVFLDHARRIRELGAAVVVMAFDEQGQADTFERKIEICGRSYRLLTEKAGFDGCDIVFDPNVLAVGTGISEHADYALNFIRATQWITANLPGASVSGGVSNLSFAFRGNNELRKAMHAVFIDHARKVGLGMAIMNPSAPVTPSPQMSDDMLEAINDLLLNRRPDATDRLLAIASAMLPAEKKTAVRATAKVSPQSTVSESIMRGTDDGLTRMLDDALTRGESAMQIINGTLMPAMDKVGELFGRGEMFLPQVVRAASVMRKAIDHLTPYITGDESTDADKRPLMVLATVKGDVHDIGKNIVATVMRCSGFDVIDLGVMTPPETIIETAIEKHADMIGLSGLITPSLDEMAKVARLMQEKGMTIPLFIGGATTSDMHTAVKLAPLYDGLVIRTADAASLPPKARRINETEQEIRARQADLRAEFARKEAMVSLEQAREHTEAVTEPAAVPAECGVFDFHPTLNELRPLINERALLGEWSVSPADSSPEARRLLEDARKSLDSMPFSANVRLIIAPAQRTAPEVISTGGIEIETPRTLEPNPVSGTCPALADYIASENDHIGLFAVAIHTSTDGLDEYASLMRRILSHRLAEAATEWLHRKVRSSVWQLPEDCSIRPAVGYPCLPDHALIFTLDRLLNLQQLGIKLTEHGAMSPDSSTCGLILAHPSARYFAVRR